MPLVVIGLMATGCKTYKQQNTVITAWRQGNITNAVAEATRKAGESTDKNVIIWRLEQGATLRADGKYEESNTAFEQATQKIDDYSEKAKVRLGQEAGAMLSNQANLAYEGRSYDSIMANTYMALNYLCLGDAEKARPEIIRAYQRQQDAVEANKRRIEKTQEEAEEAAKDKKDQKAIENAEKDPKFQSALSNSTTNLNDVKVYADYVNPFTVYLDGLFFMANSTGPSDSERAVKSFERVASFVEGNEYVNLDLATANDLANGKKLSPTTYVIFETGCAPIRDQIRIDIPILISKVSYVGAAFPTLKFQGDFQPVLNVSANGTNYPTRLICSMDSVVSTDFKNDQPMVITKTIISTVTKAVAAYIANDAARQANQWAGLISQVATAGYQMAVNIADTRTWTTLPKEFQICRFPTPADGKIELVTPNGIRMPVTLGQGDGPKVELTSPNAEASLNAGALINVVYVKSITAGTPLLVSQFKLK